eukprot:9425452-Karenia_brevis.AAC.1
MVIEMYPLRELFQWIGFRVVWIASTDSSAARGMSLRSGIGKLRHLDTRSLWTQYAVKDLNLHVTKVLGTVNPADLGTKCHTASEHTRLMKLSDLVLNVPSAEVAEADVHVVSGGGVTG